MSEANILLFEEGVGVLSTSALDLAKKGFDVTYAASVDEARLLATEHELSIQVVVFSSDLDDTALASVIGALASLPRLIAMGKDPGLARRNSLHEAGASWGIWGSADSTRLRLALSVALDLRDITPIGSPFIISNQGVELRGDAESPWEQGILWMLNADGAFVETTLKLRPGAEIEIRTLQPGPKFRANGHVAMRRDIQKSRVSIWPRGVGIKIDHQGESERNHLLEILDSEPSAFNMK